MPKTLITGGTGLIGYHLAKALHAQGADLRLMHRCPHRPGLWSDWDVECVGGDLSEPGSLTKAVAGCDHVYHVAACVSASVGDAKLMQRVNVHGTTALVKAAANAGVKRLINVSSIAAIGVNQLEPANESEPYNHAPGQPYNETKRDAEVAAHKFKGPMEVLSVRPSLVVGVGPFRLGTIAKLIRIAMKTGLPIAPVGGVNVVDVEDVVAVLIAAMGSGEDGDRFLATGHNIKTRLLMNTICELIDKPGPMLTLPHVVTSRIGALFKLWCALKLPGQPPAQAVGMSGTPMYYNDDWTRARLRLSEAKPLQQTLQERIDWERSQS